MGLEKAKQSARDIRKYATEARRDAGAASEAADKAEKAAANAEALLAENASRLRKYATEVRQAAGAASEAADEAEKAAEERELLPEPEESCSMMQREKYYLCCPDCGYAYSLKRQKINRFKIPGTQLMKPDICAICARGYDWDASQS